MQIDHIKIKRVYEKPSDRDGKRILVDRLWPRGLAKSKAKIDYWAKSIAPSTALRSWYQHDPQKWPEFKQRYFKELDKNTAGREQLFDQIDKQSTTLLFGSKESQYNNAWALLEYLKKLD